MRTLKFIVEGQIIKKDPNCDFTNLIPGSEGCLRAEFSFSPEWDGFAKAVRFLDGSHKDISAQLLKDGKSCTIPGEVLAKYGFRVGVAGKKHSARLITNTVAVVQNGGKV